MSSERVAGGPGIHLEGERITRVFGDRTVLDVDRLEVPAGDTVALLGPSGSGKSTLSRILGLLDEPTSGRVRYDGSEVTVKDDLAREQVTAVFQRPFLMRGTVAYNVAYGLRLRGVAGEERDRRVAEALDRVGLAGYEERSAITLSGGEAQRVALARGLVLRPRLVLLDEPLASLDPLVKAQVLDVFRAALSGGEMSALYVTHDQDEAFMIADRVAVMREGRIVSEGPVDQVMGVPDDEWLAGFFGMMDALDGVVTESQDGLTTVRCDGATIRVVGEEPVGTAVRVGVRPEDVTLFVGAEPPVGSSALNMLAGTVAGTRPTGASWRVDVSVGKVAIAASVSRASYAELGLGPGCTVIATFKATAVRMRRAETIDRLS
jgi:molybdopterin-binding protein